MKRFMAPVLIAAVAAVAPAAAQADSLVYVKNGTVYVSHPDGSQARAVTSGANGWVWPSETDAGVIAVAGGLSRIVNGTFNPSGGDQIFEFDQQGHQLSGPVNTQGSYSTVGDPEYVSHFRVAPDNSYVAYSVFPSYTDSYASLEKPAGSNFTYPKDDMGAPLPYSSPEWWGSGDLLITHDGVTIGSNAEYALYHLADGTTPGWDNDTAIGSSGSYQVVFSRDGRKSAVLDDDSADWTDGSVHNASITFETSSGNLPNTSWTNSNCTITLPAGQYQTLNGTKLASMSFSADGNTLAWAQDDGIYEANVSNLGNCASVTGSVHMVVPGGAMPFLGAAALSPGPKPPPPPPPPGHHKRPTARILSIKVDRRHHSAKVRFSGHGTGKVTFQCRLDHGHWHSCRSGQVFRHLRRGRHTLYVRAHDRIGYSLSAARRTFKVGA